MTQTRTRFWGKAKPLESARLAWHTVAAHSLDVAAVATLLPRPTTRLISRRTLGFLVALHDIGKFSRPFQAMRQDLWPADVLGSFPTSGTQAIRHDAAGYAILETVTDDLTEAVLPCWTAGDATHVWQALAGHHGRPVVPAPVRDHVLCAGCKDAARGFVVAMCDLFRPPPLELPRRVRGSRANLPARLGWDLAGLVTLADWVGSRQQWFPYTQPDSVDDPAAYFWDHALPRAASALSAAGLGEASPSRFISLGALFPTIQAPSPVQRWAEQVALPEGPVLAIIEDVTGSGKTEAAITLAHRLLASDQAGGVFLALPTMATANAMFGRMADAYHRLFVPEARPSLVLAHGRAHLDARFAELMHADPSPGPERSDPADMPSEAHCAAWLADDRRRALLAQFGVGTIDQALLSVLAVRHAALRQQGLKRKVLIVDEAHAFDAYMRRELVELLRFHAAMGGSAILLSATLPLKLRAQLVDAFRSGLPQAVPVPRPSSTDYPLTTLAFDRGVTEEACGMREGLARTVVVSRLPDAEAALARIASAARTDAAVAWVRNTVDDAITAADALRNEGLDPILFHARFALCDRLAIENEVLRRFGRDSAGEPRRAVLVATQVIEQSLDLDFDLLCTDLAPADLLIQRAGRLWRHERGARPVTTPELLIVSPEAVDAPGADWIRGPLPGTAAVYHDPALLWRGARALFALGSITTPDDMRKLVEAAADGPIPAALSSQVERAEGKDRADSQMARQNTLKLDTGYSRGDAGWEPDTVILTRLEDRPQVTIRLALERGGKVVPYASDDTLTRAWSLSEVSTGRHRVTDCPAPPHLAAAATDARAGWGRWERESPRLLLAVMTPEGDSYRFAARTETGEPVIVCYDPRLGLRFQPQLRDEP